MPSKHQPTADRRAKFWRELGLLPGAPDCVVKAAHRYLIEIHHPDRGGSDKKAKAVNIARDEVAGEGLAANEYVAQNYTGEPWHVLGVMANADRDLVERAGRALATELKMNHRLVERIEWAMKNFGAPTNGARTATQQPAQPQRRTTAERPPAKRPKAAAGKPEGLVDRVDFGTLPWRSTAKKELRLTWREFAPYRIRAEVASPVVAEVIESKALPGRFIVALSIDWDALDRDRAASIRGYALDAALTIGWPGDGEAVVRVRGVLHFPATVFASPESLNLGTAVIDERKATSVALVSNSATVVTIEPTPWLQRVDNTGSPTDAPIQLTANTPYRVALQVDWAPIHERGEASLAAGKPLRPTGRITVRWDESSLEIPVQMVAKVR
jgi:hypothetical protein